MKGYRCLAWGDNEFGQCDVPEGMFTQIACGFFHSLGLRKDGTIECWGQNHYGQCDAPEGVFRQIAADAHYSVGLKKDGTIAIWGEELKATRACRNDFLMDVLKNSLGIQDKKVFKQVATGGGRIIALRDDGSTNMWGQCSDVPDGVFSQVDLGHMHGVALRKDGSVTCWGQSLRGSWSDAAPSGVFTQVGANRNNCVGLREDGTVACWGGMLEPSTTHEVPEGVFVKVTCCRDHGFALRSDGTIACWGDNQHGQCDAPDAAFFQVAGCSGHSLGLVID